MNKLITSFLLIAISLLTTACGQAGGLYLPSTADTHPTNTQHPR